MTEITLLIIKIAFTIFMAVLIPVYWKNHGWQNFLWLSDIGLFLTLFGLWFNSSLLISTAIILTLPLDIAWIIDFFYQLITGQNLLGIVNYMFNPNLSLLTRGLSLFHIFMPLIWLWCLSIWGYDKRALIFATILVWTVLITTYIVTTHHRNINWVYFPAIQKLEWLSSLQWLMIMLIGFPIFLLWPMHLIIKRFFG